MLKSTTCLMAGVTLATILPLSANAETNWAVSGGLGTLGGNAEIKVQLNDYFDVRGGYNYFTVDVDETYSGITYEGDLDMSGLGAYIDLRPFKNSFILSAGAHFGDKLIDLEARSNENISIGDQVFTPAQAGVLDLKAELTNPTPFLGLGYDSTFQNDGPWGVKLLVGSLFTGEADVTLESRDGLFSTDPTFLAELEKERLKVEEEAEDFKFYPVVQAGLSYRF